LISRLDETLLSGGNDAKKVRAMEQISSIVKKIKETQLLILSQVSPVFQAAEKVIPLNQFFQRLGELFPSVVREELNTVADIFMSASWEYLLKKWAVGKDIYDTYWEANKKIASLSARAQNTTELHLQKLLDRACKQCEANPDQINLKIFNDYADFACGFLRRMPVGFSDNINKHINQVLQEIINYHFPMFVNGRWAIPPYPGSAIFPFDKIKSYYPHLTETILKTKNEAFISSALEMFRKILLGQLVPEEEYKVIDADFSKLVELNKTLASIRQLIVASRVSRRFFGAEEILRRTYVEAADFCGKPLPHSELIHGVKCIIDSARIKLDEFELILLPLNDMVQQYKNDLDFFNRQFNEIAGVAFRKSFKDTNSIRKILRILLHHREENAFCEIKEKFKVRLRSDFQKLTDDEVENFCTTAEEKWDQILSMQLALQNKENHPDVKLLINQFENVATTLFSEHLRNTSTLNELLKIFFHRRKENSLGDFQLKFKMRTVSDLQKLTSETFEERYALIKNEWLQLLLLEHMALVISSNVQVFRNTGALDQELEKLDSLVNQMFLKILHDKPVESAVSDFIQDFRSNMDELKTGGAQPVRFFEISRDGLQMQLEKVLKRLEDLFQAFGPVALISSSDSCTQQTRN
jgi:hypothetical protein